MKPRVKDILAVLEELAPSARAASWDNPGLQVGDPNQEVGLVLLALDPTPEVLARAIARGAQMLLCHHPLIFPHVQRLDWGSFPGMVVAAAARAWVSIAAAHTNLDAAVPGINTILASLFGLQNVAALEGEAGEAGIGCVGDLVPPLDLSALVARTREVLRLSALRVVAGAERPIRRLAVVGGSGGSLAPLAAAQGAEALLTGDVTHHQALAAQALGLTVIDGGHFETERIALEHFAPLFAAALRERGWHLAVAVDMEEQAPVSVLA